MSFFKNMILLTIICFTIPSCVSDQIPDKVLNAFMQKYPSVTEKKWSLDSHRNYEVKFKLKGIKHRADFDCKSGNWIETEVNIKYNDLPKAVRESVQANYNKEKISEIEKVEHHLKGHFYDVEFVVKGKKFDIEFDEKGNVVGYE